MTGPGPSTWASGPVSQIVELALAPYRLLRSTAVGRILDSVERSADSALLAAYTYAFFDAPAPVRRLQARVSYDVLSLAFKARLPGARGVGDLDDRTAGSGFLNYGYADEGHDSFEAGLTSNLRQRSHSVRLYDLVASATRPSGGDVLEIGCGRGGGCRYVWETMSPASVTGVDLSPQAIEFCTSAFSAPGLAYLPGDAESLSFEDSSFDSVINVESSHCYGSMPAFLGEVHRVLRPGGLFGWADARPADKVSVVDLDFLNCGLEVVEERDISKNVLLALDATSDEKTRMIDGEVPFLLRPLSKSALAVRGSIWYESLSRGDMVYLFKVARKPQ